MEFKSEFLPPAEIPADINQDLKMVLNEGLNNSIGEFNRSNTKKESKSVQRYLDCLDTICSSIDDQENPNDGDFYSVREQRLDKEHDIFYIKLAPESKIDKTHITRYQSPGLDLLQGPVDECQISIKPFCEYKGTHPDPSKLISQTGFEIDFSVSKFCLKDGRMVVSPKQAGIGLRLYQDGSGVSFLKTYIGSEDFQSKRSELKSSEAVGKTTKYLSTLGLYNPTDKFK